MLRNLRRGFTLIELMICMAIAGILIVVVAGFFAGPAHSQEVSAAQTGTYTVAPGAVMTTPNPIHPFRSSTVVGPVVTFPSMGGHPVDWAALRATRLRDLAEQAAGRVNFGFDSAELDAKSIDAVTGLAQLLTDNPDLDLAIEGYTDSTGDPAYNLALGLRRAEAVSSLIQDAGVSSSRVHVIAFGEEKPTIARAFASERHENRRVEFHLVDNMQGATLN